MADNLSPRLSPSFTSFFYQGLLCNRTPASVVSGAGFRRPGRSERKTKLMRFTIKLKLALAFGVLLLLSGTAGWIGIVKLAAIDGNIKSLLSGPVELQNQIMQLEQAVHASVRHEKNLTLFTDAGEIKHALDELQEDHRRIPAKAEDVAKLVSGEARDKFNELRGTLTQLLANQDQIAEFGQRDTAGEALQLAGNEGRAAFGEMLTSLRQLGDSLTAQPSAAIAPNAVSGIMVQLAQAGREELGMILAPSDEAAAAHGKAIKAAISAVAGQREAFLHQLEGQNLALAAQFFERFDKWRAVDGSIEALAQLRQQAAGHRDYDWRQQKGHGCDQGPVRCPQWRNRAANERRCRGERRGL